ncbi:MAG: hypothetical protein BWY78_00046 [Alphaproteobacteria bacterium ADurb.Bin438]|nr:MAG: hypothetical protein BWY78_00046 [Alphaproteobacteria bacterium ADurb.Bin438]
MKLMVLILTVLLMSCQNTRSDYCLIADVIYINDNDVLSPDTAKAILKNNMTYEKLCK